MTRALNSAAILPQTPSEITRNLTIRSPHVLNRFSFFTLCILTLQSVATEAAIIVSIDSTSIAVGGTGFVDVRLISTDAEQLYGYSVEFEISSSSGRTLEFVQTLGLPPDTHLADGDYVFADDGSAAITSGSSGFVGPNTTYVGIDVSDNPLGFTGDFDRLLTRLDLTTLTGNAPLAGDVFTIQLTNANGNTYFKKDPLFIADSDPLFDGNLTLNPVFGTITITAAAAAVPEPGFALLSGIIGLSVAIRHRRFRRSLAVRE